MQYYKKGINKQLDLFAYVFKRKKISKMSVAYLVKIVEVKGYSPNTIKTYSYFIIVANGYFKNH
jgi:hypothetical protein